MWHPFENVPAGPRLATFWILTGLNLLILAVLGSLYLPLENSTAPQGIVSLELATTPERLNGIVSSWSEEPKVGMAFSLGLNFLCLLTLTNVLALACVMAASRLSGGVARLGILLAWSQWAAGIFWAVQNSLLAWAVLGHATPFGVTLASLLATVKFALVGTGLLYAVVAGGAAAMRRR
jgi:hypothetical protein